MRVSFDHKEISKGIIFKKSMIEVITTVVFSADELAIIKNRKLKDFVVFERRPDAVVTDRFKNDAAYLESLVEGYTISVGKLMSGKPDSYTCATPVHAKNYEQEFTAALKKLKDFIAGSAEKPESKTIEL